VAIVGAGFGGIGMAVALRRAGISNVVVLERAAEIGGTWRDNTYPGCACDIPSMLYSFSFALNPEWTRTYPPQDEIWSYLRTCVQREDLRRSIRFGAEVASMRFDDAAHLWHIEARNGSQYRARVVVAALGGLSNPAMPEILGIEAFEGPAFHSARWRHDVDLRGKRVAVIGTGASAIQFVPQIAPQAAELTVYQRTPPWIIPRHDRPISKAARFLRRRMPGYARLERAAIYASLEARALGFVTDTRIVKIGEVAARAHLKRQVRDPALRAKLTPEYTMGCKRVLISDDYYPALCRPNVRLETAAIRAIDARGVATADGAHHGADVLIFGTGFRAQSFVSPVRIYGSGGSALDDAWRERPQAYLGIATAGFPNLFFLIGPNTGLGHNSMIVMIEAQIAFVMSALRLMRERSCTAIDVTPAAQAAFVEEIDRRSRSTVWAAGCRSWYLDERGRNTAIWPGFTLEYRARTRRIDPRAFALAGS
jgi:cation diffusion facilitator CzcD-associated flavoprotein CzcO